MVFFILIHLMIKINKNYEDKVLYKQKFIYE